MRHIYAAETSEEVLHYQSFVNRIQPNLNNYLDFLHKIYQVTSLPRTIVWTNAEIATKLISDIPVPAYTNEFRTVFCPELDSWREIYLKQLDGIQNAEVRRYYETRLTENHILQILGHEFVHHSELFLDGFDGDYESGIWFEEGMCEYISRKYFLTKQEFDEEASINAALVKLFRERYGNHSLENFGAATYAGDYASIFCEYWRSFLAVRQLVDDHAGDVMAVFREYHRWTREGSGKSLTEWLDINI